VDFVRNILGMALQVSKDMELNRVSSEEANVKSVAYLGFDLRQMLWLKVPVAHISFVYRQFLAVYMF
jgi:hypothetical protein